MASAFGPRVPWQQGLPPGIKEWSPDHDTWELYNLNDDWSQAEDLADELPEKLSQMKETFAIEAARNSVYPVGGGLWIIPLHPELVSTPYREWNSTGDIVRMPESCAPALGNRANTVTIDAEICQNAHGVLYALGANSGA
jgi:arylsulfatase